eukprot:jgi/Chlat1/2243/Chrsp17S02784
MPIVSAGDIARALAPARSSSSCRRGGIGRQRRERAGERVAQACGTLQRLALLGRWWTCTSAPVLPAVELGGLCCSRPWKLRRLGSSKQQALRSCVRAMEEPQKPGLGDCCAGGCTPCVWDVYYEQLEKYQEEQRSAEVDRRHEQDAVEQQLPSHSDESSNARKRNDTSTSAVDTILCELRHAAENAAVNTGNTAINKPCCSFNAAVTSMSRSSSCQYCIGCTG